MNLRVGQVRSWEGADGRGVLPATSGDKGNSTVGFLSISQHEHGLE